MDIPRLHQDTIDEVKQRSDIYEVVSERVVLKKQGKDFVGLCPFHDEKSPSFTVSPSKQMYYCFGCGVGGNAIKFMMEVGKRSFGEVVLDLARRYQVPIKTEEPEKRQELQRQISQREQLYEILAIAEGFYEHALSQPQGRLALEYLQSERRLSPETIQQFHIGYAPAGWETLYRYMVEVKRYPVQIVEQSGLIKQRSSGDGYYDQFRDRIIIPIHDIQGRIIGFGGRTLTDEQPKYLNSPETQLFDKGKTLFALDKAKTAISKEDKAVVVEGYFDAIALHAAGIANVVASLGTALSLAQVRQLLRYTESKQIVLNFDGDKAGNKATQRAIGEIANLAYQGQVQLRILNIPDGKDADEFLKTHSSEQYRELLENGPLWLDWQIQQLLVGKDLKQADKSQQVAQEMVKLLCNIINDNLIFHYCNYCAELLSQGDYRRITQLQDNLLKQVHRLSRRGGDKSPQQALPVAGDRNLLEQAEALLLRIYLHCPSHRQAIIEALEERDLQFSLSHHRFLWRQIVEVQTPNIEPNQLISKLQDRSEEFNNELSHIYHLFYLDEKTKQDILREPLAIRSAAASMERVMREKRYRHFLEQWQQTDCNANPDVAQYYQQQFYAEKVRIQELDRQRNVTILDLIQMPWVGLFST